MNRQVWLLATTTLLVAAVLATFVSCGRTHSSAVGAHRDAPAPGGSRTAPTIPLADVLARIDATPVPKGVSAQLWATLKMELKRQIVARSRDGKFLSTAPTGLANAVSDLAAASNPAGTQATLTWTEKLAGDYNNDGVVDIIDLQPLALYYMQRIDTGADDAHKLVNGDADPEINIGDLQAVANDYMAKVEGYQVWRGSYNGTATNWEATFRPNVQNPSNTSFSAGRPSPPPVSTRPANNYTDDISALADKTNVRYKVVPFGDSTTGVESNEAIMPFPGPPYWVSGTVTESGGGGLAGVLLTLTPGGYNATTQANGAFVITSVPNGTYTLTPTKNGYSFSPLYRSVTVSGADMTGQDFTGAQSGLADSAWPKFRGNSRNTGQSPYIGTQTNHVKWTYTTGGGVYSSPGIGADGTVYVGSYDHYVYALNPADGSVKWTLLTGDVVKSSPTVGADGTIYVGSSDHKVYALNPLDGTVKWSYTTPDVVVSSPAIGADGTVYVGGHDCKVYALYPSDGTLKWIHTGTPWSSDWLDSSPAIGPDGTVYVGLGNDVHALDSSDGSSKWTFNSGGAASSSPALGADGTLYVGGGDGNLYALNPSSGTTKWSCHTGGGLDSPAIGPDGTVYVGSADTKIYAINRTDGSVKWTVTGSAVPSSPAVGADGTVYVGSYDNNVYALNASDGSVKWSYATGASVYGSPAIGADGTVYIGSTDGKVYAFGPWSTVSHSVSGTVTESGVGLAGALMTLTPGGLNATTQANGVYTITGAVNGSYTLTPSKAGYAFTPPSRPVTVAGLDVGALDFGGTSGPDPNSPWPKFHGNAQNTGLSPYVGAQTNAVKWTFTASNHVYSSPAIGPDGTVYVGSDDTNVYAINPSDGTVKWSRATGNAVPACPAVGADGTVYAGSNDNSIYALSPLDGSIKWTYTTGGMLYGSPAIAADGTIYVGSDDHTIYALNPDGSPKWQHSTAWSVDTCPAIAPDGTLYVGSDQLYALNPSDGSVKWQYATNGHVYSSAAIGADGTVYVGCDGGNVYAINPSDGSVKWSYLTGNYITSSPAVGNDGTIYVGSDDDKIYALNPDGSVKWTYTTGSFVETSSPAIGADGTVYVGSCDHKVYAVNGADGSLKWVYTTGDFVYSSPAIGADGTVYVGSNDNKLYAFGP